MKYFCIGLKIIWLIAIATLCITIVLDYLIPFFIIGVLPNPITGVNWLLVSLLICTLILKRSLVYITIYVFGIIHSNTHRDKAIFLDDSNVFTEDSSVIPDINPSTGLIMDGNMDLGGHIYGEDDRDW